MAKNVLGKTCVPIKARAMMYKAVVLELLLYGSKVWLATDEMMTVLEGFHHSIARQISGMTARKGDSGELKWALVETVLEIIGVWTIRE